MFSANLKRGSMELLILSMLDGKTRHGYEIGKLLEHHSAGQLEFRVSTLYTALYRMEGQAWIKGRWVEKRANGGAATTPSRRREREYSPDSARSGAPFQPW